MRNLSKTSINIGFSLIELVVSMFILTVLSLVSITYFQSFINQAKLAYAKVKLDECYKLCLSKVSISDIKSLVPGVVFSNSKEGDAINCQDKLIANINNYCCIDLDMANGEKNNTQGWPYSYSLCDPANCLANRKDESDITEYTIQITKVDNTGNTSQESLKVSLEDDKQLCMRFNFGSIKIQVCLNPPSINLI